MLLQQKDFLSVHLESGPGPQGWLWNSQASGLVVKGSFGPGLGCFVLCCVVLFCFSNMFLLSSFHPVASTQFTSRDPTRSNFVTMIISPISFCVCSRLRASQTTRFSASILAVRQSGRGNYALRLVLAHDLHQKAFSGLFPVFGGLEAVKVSKSLMPQISSLHSFLLLQLGNHPSVYLLRGPSCPELAASTKFCFPVSCPRARHCSAWSAFGGSPATLSAHILSVSSLPSCDMKFFIT